MTSDPKRLPFPAWDLCALAVLLIPASFLYLWRTLQTSLIYTAFGDLIDFPVFLPTREFLLQTLASPAGPVKYLSNFLSQAFANDALGALVLTAVAAAFYLTTLRLLQAAASMRSHVLAAAPAIAALALYGDYNHHLLSLLTLLAPVTFAAAFLTFRPRTSTAALILFTAAFALLYWIAAAASLLFAVLAALAELLRRQWLTAVLQIAIALTLAWLIGTAVFLLEMPAPFTAGLPIFPIRAALARFSITYLYLFFPAAILTAAAVKTILDIAKKRTPAPHRRKKHRPKQTPPHHRLPAPLPAWLKTAAAIAIIAPAAAFAALTSHDQDRKHVLHMNSLLRRRQWNAYIDAAKTFHRRRLYNPQINHDINRALYHTGALCDQMFSFDQRGPALLIVTAEPVRFAAKFLRAADLFFEMGNINDAEHWTCEVLEAHDSNPLALQRLVDINLAKNQPQAAAVFLNALAKDLVHRPYATRRLRLLQSDPAAQSDPRIANARQFNWRNHKVLAYDNLEYLLLALLEENPNNRMAFEYLMALYLLSHSQDKIVANLHRLDAIGYDRIPTHLEEAAIIYSDKTRQPVNLHGRQISPQTVQRHRRYLEAFKKAGGNRDAAFRALAPEFGNSYFFYSMFNASGLAR